MNLKELVMQYLAGRGIQEAAAVYVTINGEEPLLIDNEGHPAMAREIGDGSDTKIRIVNSAKAGLYSSNVDRQPISSNRIQTSLVEDITAQAASLPLKQQQEVLALIEALQKRAFDSAQVRSRRLKGAAGGLGPTLTLESLREARKEMWGEYMENEK